MGRSRVKRPSTILENTVWDSSLIYEVRPGWAEGVETCHLERTASGVRVVLNMGGVVYRLEPTVFVLEGILHTLRRIARGEVRHAQLGPVGIRALELSSQAVRIAA